MIEIDIAKAGATTILSCGPTNAGYYSFIQQGLNSWVESEESKNIFEILKRYAPIPPGDKWVLIQAEMRDYKSSPEKYHHVYAQYKFRRGEREEYSNESEIPLKIVKEVYKLFETAVKDQRR